MDIWTLIDTETDGLYPPIHVIEVAAQKFSELTPAGEPFRVFIDHNIAIPASATAIHGYTSHFIRKVGISPRQAYRKLREYVDGDPIASHNLSFDWNRALCPELIRLQEPDIGVKGFCTLKLARRALPEQLAHNLPYLKAFFDLPSDAEHQALSDVNTVTHLLSDVIFPRLATVGITSLPQVCAFANMLPLLKAKCLIQGLDFEEEQEKIRRIREEKKRWEAFLRQVELGIHSLPDLILEHGLIEENPNVIFSNKTFLFTGKMLWGSRPQMKSFLEARNGRLSASKVITDDIDYLILGEDPQKGWTTLTGGNKLKRAFSYKFRNQSASFQIIKESDLINSLEFEN